MRTKIFHVLIALVMITSLVACDNVSDIMNKMGNNIAGVDEEYAEQAAESTKVTEEEKTKAETSENIKVGETTLTTSTKISYTDKADGTEKELITVGKKTTEDGKEVQVVAIGEYAISLPETVTADIAGITALLPPKDLKEITAVFDGAGKEILIETLSKPVTDKTTLEAAKGTATLVQGLLEVASGVIGDDEEDSTKVLVNTITSGIKDSLDENNEKELTMGDVIVLQAVTNIISDASEEVLSLVNTDEQEGSEDGEKADVNPTVLLEKANDSIMETVSILNNVGDAASAFSGIDLETVIKLVTNK